VRNTQDISAQVKVEDGVTATLATGANSVTLANAIETGTSGTKHRPRRPARAPRLHGGTELHRHHTASSGGRIVLGGNDRPQRPVRWSRAEAAASGVLQLGDALTASTQTFDSIATAGSGSANAIVGGNASSSMLTISNSAAVVFAGQLGGVGANENNLALAKLGCRSAHVKQCREQLHWGCEHHRRRFDRHQVHRARHWPEDDHDQRHGEYADTATRWQRR